jgi:uncharacterized protein YkwD
MRSVFLFATLLLPQLAFAQLAVPPNTGNCLNPQEAELLRLVNEYRQQNGLPAVSASLSLASVGQWHVWDLMANSPAGGACNMHSWSNARPTQWQGMCYTADHAQAQQMWSKPAQITANRYTSAGYENAAAGSAGISAATALNLWRNSSAHNDVILNRGIWAQFPWRAMGAGMFGNFAVLWFGTANDPQGTITVCGSGGPSDVLLSNSFE